MEVHPTTDADKNPKPSAAVLTWSSGRYPDGERARRKRKWKRYSKIDEGEGTPEKTNKEV